MYFQVQNRTWAGVLCLSAMFAGAADAGIIDFNGYPAGTIMDGEYAAAGVAVRADNARSTAFNIATLFNAAGTSGLDADLQGPWDLGNIAPGGPGGNVLIVQDQRSRTIANGRITRPNDEGSRPAGSLFFTFATPIKEFGFDLLDIEGPAEFNGNSGFFATFFGAGTPVKVGFDQFIAAGPYYRAGVVYGNNSANRIAPITAQQLGIPDGFTMVEINLGGSGGIDNINYQNVPAVPEPAMIGILAAGLLAIRRARSGTARHVG
jgi:hypothetical protein